MLANQSGVSKSMLGQIERGEVNPTISVLWKTANGLKVTFTSLIDRPQASTEVVRAGELKPITEDEARFQNFPVFPYTADRPFEIYRIKLLPAARLQADPHPLGTLEFISVYSGALSLKVGEEVFELSNGDSICFQADVVHSYLNLCNEETNLSMVIYYPQAGVP